MQLLMRHALAQVLGSISGVGLAGGLHHVSFAALREELPARAEASLGGSTGL